MIRFLLSKLFGRRQTRLEHKAHPYGTTYEQAAEGLRRLNKAVTTPRRSEMSNHGKTFRNGELRIFHFDNQWWWVLEAQNGMVIAQGGEGYSRRIDCVNAVDKLVDRFNRAIFVIEKKDGARK